MKTLEMEIALAEHFGFNRNIIVPNIRHGMGLNYEADLVVLTPAGYATEIEIKVSRSDIKKDLDKKLSAHYSPLFAYFYYAVPTNLVDCEYLPQDKGLMSVEKSDKKSQSLYNVSIVRKSKKKQGFYKWDDEDRGKLMRLATMRVWGLKRKLNKHNL